MEIQMWREILIPYDLAVKELTVKFEHLIQEYHYKGRYCPIEHVTGRVKTVSSILGKAQKKGIPIAEIEDKIQDIAGLRIICQFVEDIPRVVEMIRDRKDMSIRDERDYVTHQKDSGYRSYHIIIGYKVNCLDGQHEINVEIQIRTMAMNFWSTIDHSLQYKYKAHIPEHIQERLSKASQAVVALDNEMSSVRDEIMDAQNSLLIRANLVSEILTSIQNLYHLANKREILKIQDEFYRVYEMNDMEQLNRFARELDVIAEGYRAQSVPE